VQNDPARADSALDISWRAAQHVDDILRRLPPEPDLYFRFLKLLVTKQQWDAANHVWSALLALHRPYDPHQALFYVDALLANRDVAAAENAWQELGKFGSFRPYLTPDNLIANPIFDRDLLNAGFGWRYAPRPGVAASLDETQGHGSHSLLITFSGPNSDTGLYQYVVVKPGTSYSVSAWVKSEDLQTANGPYLAVYNGFQNVEYAHSEETLGNTSWHRVQASFAAGRDDHLVAVRFVRQPGTTHITGKFWLTDVQFVAVLSNSTSRLLSFHRPVARN
jgi:hypothetical protein